MRPLPEFHPLVRFDLDDSATWYEAAESGLGERFRLEAFSEALRPGRAWQHSVRFSDIRRANLRAFPHGLFYFVHDETVIVLGILHAARDTEAELRRRRACYAS